MIDPKTDRTAIYLSIRLVNADEGELDMSAEIANRFISLQLVEEDKKVDQWQMTLMNDDLHFLDDRRFADGQQLEVSWGYKGHMTPERIMQISGREGMETLTLKGSSEVYNYDLEPVFKTWENVTYSDAVREIAEAKGFTGERLHLQETTVVQETILQKETDARFVARLARKIGWLFYIDHLGWHFHPRLYDQPPVKIYSYKRVVEGSHPGGEIIGSPRLEDTKKKKDTKAGKVKIYGRDRNTGVKYEVEATETGLVRPGLGYETEAPPPGETSGQREERLARETVIPVSGLTEEEAKLRVEEIQKRMASGRYTLTFPAIGDPDVCAKQIVEVHGISDFLSGKFYLQKVQHDVKVGDYTQTLTMKKDNPAQVPKKIGKDKSHTGGDTQTGAQPNETDTEGGTTVERPVLVLDHEGNLVPAKQYVGQGQSTGLENLGAQ